MRSRVAIIQCSLAQRDHARAKRQYAHTHHFTDTICVCREFWALPLSHITGILAHELGHLLAPGDEHSEEEADNAFTEKFGIFISYRNTPYGARLQFLPPAWQSQFLNTFKINRDRKYIEVKKK